MSPATIFISHTHTDQAVADAVRDAIFELFGRESIAVTYSTSRELGGGVPIGEDWFRWIGEQVHTAAVTLVLLTPTSVQKPWVLWEAGAVYGAALTSDDATLRRVRPLAFQIGMDDIPPHCGVVTHKSPGEINTKTSSNSSTSSFMISSVMSIKKQGLSAPRREFRLLQEI